MITHFDLVVGRGAGQGGTGEGKVLCVPTTDKPPTAALLLELAFENFRTAAILDK